MERNTGYSGETTDPVGITPLGCSSGGRTALPANMYFGRLPIRLSSKRGQWLLQHMLKRDRNIQWAVKCKTS